MLKPAVTKDLGLSLTESLRARSSEARAWQTSFLLNHQYGERWEFLARTVRLDWLQKAAKTGSRYPDELAELTVGEALTL